MENSKKKSWIKLIHTAKRQLNLDDETYRALLYGAAGIDSAKELITYKQFDDIMQAFKNIGFQYHHKQDIIIANRASKMQIAYIKKLWNLGSRSKTESGLRQFLNHLVHVDSVNFLTKQQASAVILALEDINKKAQESQNEECSTNRP